MVGRIDLARTHERGPHAEARVDLRELRSRWARAEDHDARRKLAEARPLLIRPVPGLLQALERRDFPDRADRDDHVLRLERPRSGLRLDGELPRSGESCDAANGRNAHLLVIADVTRVVRVVAALANDHVVAPRRSLLPRVVAAERADLRRVQQGLRRHTAPEGARPAEKIALDERDARAARTRVARSGL